MYEEWVEPDPSKITAITHWNQRTNVTELRQLFGLCGYYRRFVPKFVSIAGPLHRLTDGVRQPESAILRYTLGMD